MTSVELLKQSERIVSEMIRERTPPVFETCREALNDLGELVAHAQKCRYADNDEVTPTFAAAIEEVVQRLAPYQAGAVGKLGEPKKFSLPEFVSHFQTETNKALKEDAATGLARLHALRAGIAKASFFGDDAVGVAVYVDPFQQATLASEGGSSATSSGTAGVGGDTGVVSTSTSIAELMSATVRTLTKSREDSSQGPGWVPDLSTREFLTGEQKHAFGRDGAK